MWIIRNKDSKENTKLIYEDHATATQRLNDMPSSIKKFYEVAYTGTDKYQRMLVEGLVKRDLEGILLPKLSVDEYIPSDADTDNIVFAFFIKNVPEAVLPFVNFMLHCMGVIDVDYSDSETMYNTTVVYAECDRETFKMSYIKDIMKQVSMLTNLVPEDFTLTFPSTSEKFPYSPETLESYFEHRNAKKNLEAQKKAESEAMDALNDEIDQSVDQSNETDQKQKDQDQKEIDESELVDKIANIMLG